MDDREMIVVRRMLSRGQLSAEQTLVALVQIMVEQRVDSRVAALRAELDRQIDARVAMKVRTEMRAESRTQMWAAKKEDKRQAKERWAGGGERALKQRESRETHAERVAAERAAVELALRIEIDGPMKMVCPECKAVCGQLCRAENGATTEIHESRLEIYRATELPEPEQRRKAG